MILTPCFLASHRCLLPLVFPAWMHTSWWALISVFLTKSSLSPKLLNPAFTVYFLLAVSQISQNQNFPKLNPSCLKNILLCVLSLSQRASLETQHLTQTPGSRSMLLVPHPVHLTGEQALLTQALPCLSIFPLTLISEIFKKPSGLDCLREWKRKNISKIFSKYVYNRHGCCILETDCLFWEMSGFTFKVVSWLGVVHLHYQV